MKKVITILVALAFGLICHAQTTREELLKNINFAGGNYFPYPTPSGRLTPPPAGFVPFYISHYGRHGARFMSEDSDVKNAIKFLKSQELNKLGEMTLAQLQRVDQLMDGRTGELTPLGYQQQKEIARRLFDNFSPVFNGKPKIVARSTYIPRSIISMCTFCLELHDLNSYYDITPIVSSVDMPMLNKDRVKDPNRPKEEGYWYDSYLQFCNKKRTSCHRLVNSLLMHPDLLNVGEDVYQQFGHSLFNVACAVQDMPDIDFSLFGLFTDDEVWNYWQAQNAFWYSFCGAYAKPNIRAREFGIDLWNDIMSKADDAIAGRGNNLDLRFGHDTGMLPFLVMMDINHPMEQVESLDQFYATFADFKVIPMAANIQFVFFRNDDGNVLVKVLVNEEEASLPLDAFDGPYYDWNKVKEHYRYLLTTDN